MEQEALQRAFFDVMHRWGKAKQPVSFLSLTKGEFLILEMLIRHRGARSNPEGMYVSRLVNDTHATGPAVSRILRLLEEKGYIERYADKADRRNTFINITKEGDAAWERAANTMRQFLCRVIDRMGHQEMTELICLWNRLIDAVDDVGSDYTV